MIVVAACTGHARLNVTRVLVDNGANIYTMTLLKWITQPWYCDNEQAIAYLTPQGATGTATFIRTVS